MLGDAVIAVLLNQIATSASPNFVHSPDRKDQSPDKPVRVWTSLISGTGDANLKGVSTLNSETFQFNVDSETKRDTLRVVRRIKSHIEGCRGMVTTTDFGDVFVAGVTYRGDRQIYNAPSDGSESGSYTHAIDFQFDIPEGYDP